MGLRSYGHHKYYAFRKLQDETIETLTNIVIDTGVPMYGQGKFVNVHAAAFIDKDTRFGFEFLSGLSGKPGLSTANKNAFTLNGKLFKLGPMDMVEGFDFNDGKGHDGEIHKLHMVSRAASSTSPDFGNSCDVWFEKKFTMRACLNLKALIVCEFQEQGFLSGSCDFE